MSLELPFLQADYKISALSERAAIIHNWMAKNETLRIPADAVFSGIRQAPDGFQRLLQPGSVAVTARFQGSLFGGPISQILKCLTAIRICEELAKHTITAVPVCWVDMAAPSTLPIDSIQLLDKESELHCLRLQKSETIDFASGAPLPQKQVEALLLQIEDFGQGLFDHDALDMIRSAFVAGSTLSSASANLLSVLMKEWGMVVLNAAELSIPSSVAQTQETTQGEAESYDAPFLAQNLVIPAIACVVDPYEMQMYARMMPYFDEYGLPRPMAWPQFSATMLDARSRRIIERYNLSLNQLYSGEEAIVAKIRDDMPSSTFEKLEYLKSETAKRMALIQALRPHSARFAKSANACTEKIIYQTQKLLDHCLNARKRHEPVTRRQIHKLCNRLAPNGRMQESELGGIQIPLRYSISGLRSLYEKLDIMNFEHQLISMD